MRLASGDAAGGYAKGWCSAQRIRIFMIAGGNHTTIHRIGLREQDAQRPLRLLLLVLFLQEQEKNEENDDNINDHLQYKLVSSSSGFISVK